MTPICKVLLLTLLLTSAEVQAWDYTTSNPCDTPVEITPDTDVAAAPTDGSIPSYSATVDLNLPLASKINTDSYNADLTGSEIDVGTALLSQDGEYINILGNETPATTTNTPSTTGCR